MLYSVFYVYYVQKLTTDNNKVNKFDYKEQQIVLLNRPKAFSLYPIYIATTLVKFSNNITIKNNP